MSTTCQCGKPTAGAIMCDTCSRLLAKIINNIDGYHRDLDDVRTKRARLTNGNGAAASGHTQPLIVDARFLEATGQGTMVENDTRTTLIAWCRTIMEDQPKVVGPAHDDCLHVSCSAVRQRRWPRDTVASMCDYLIRQQRHILAAKWAPVIHDELIDLENRLRRLVDRRPGKVFLGACTKTIEPSDACNHAVYAIEGEDWGTCTAKDCDNVYNVAASRHGLEEALDEQLYTGAEIASLSTYLALNASREQVRQAIKMWGHRGRITAHATNQNNEPMYLYGNVRVLLFMRFAPEPYTHESAHA